MAGFEITGLDELQRELEQLQQRAQELEGEHQIPFEDLFTKSFMQEYTQYSSIDELLEAGGFHAESTEEFEAIPDDELDVHIAKVTEFDSWEDMLSEATEQYLLDQLSL